MKAVLCTDNGMFTVSEEGLDGICCSGSKVYDVYVGEGTIYVCSVDHGLLAVRDGEGRVLMEGSCWRLYPAGTTLIASIEGPRLYTVDYDKVGLLGDYRGLAERLGWWFPHGPPHITDFAYYGGEVLATVEVGHLLKGPAIDSLKPTGFREDQHNILALDDKVLIATASGVYYSRDLESFKLAPGSQGYFHALEHCGELLAGHVIDEKPLRVSRDQGETWEPIDIKLPPPTFGTTGLSCLEDNRILYATTSVYIIDLESLETRIIAEGIPMVRRVLVSSSTEAL